jgi:hypothetical protein
VRQTEIIRSRFPDEITTWEIRLAARDLADRRAAGIGGTGSIAPNHAGLVGEKSALARAARRGGLCGDTVAQDVSANADGSSRIGKDVTALRAACERRVNQSC